MAGDGLAHLCVVSRVFSLSVRNVKAHVLGSQEHLHARRVAAHDGHVYWRVALLILGLGSGSGLSLSLSLLWLWLWG